MTMDRLSAALFEDYFPDRQGIEVGRFLVQTGESEKSRGSLTGCVCLVHMR
jgi:hypothetical protein